MYIEFEISDVIPASPEAIYEAWLNSEKHSQMTGGLAQVTAIVGDKFEAWDGYIQGENVELVSSKRILQHWRTTEFNETDKDSQLEIIFDPENDGTRVTIRHTALPEHGFQYRQGWIDAYFQPMKAYFGGNT